MKYLSLVAIPIVFLLLAWSNQQGEFQKPIVVTGEIYIEKKNNIKALEGAYVKLNLDGVDTDKYNDNTDAFGRFSIDVGTKDETYQVVYATFFSLPKKEHDQFKFPKKMKFSINKVYQDIGKALKREVEVTNFTTQESAAKLEINVGRINIEI